MRVLSFSGVDIPWSTLLKLTDLQSSTRSSVEARLDLVIAANANGAVIEADRFAAVCANMFENLVNVIMSKKGTPTTAE
jgi:hypothetical protein